MFSRDGRKRRGAQGSEQSQRSEQSRQDDLRSHQVVDPGQPDDMFPHLTRDRADLLREEAMRFLHDEGFDTTWRSDGYIAARPEGKTQAPPRLIGLDNLSLQLAHVKDDVTETELADYIHNFVRTVITDVDIDNLPDAEFLRQLKARLVSQDALEAIAASAAEQDTPSFDDAVREFAGDLRVALVLDTDNSVMTLNDSSLAAHGTASPDELADLFHVGYRNTWQELLDTPVDANPIQGDTTGARFWVIESESFFLASAPLFINELLARWVPGLDISEGVIVAVPHRHVMMVREVSTGSDLLEGINTMTSVALAQFTDNPGPLSPRLHLARDGEFQAFTDITTNDDGQRVLQVYPDDHLMERLNDGDGIEGVDGVDGPDDTDDTDGPES